MYSTSTASSQTPAKKPPFSCSTASKKPTRVSFFQAIQRGQFLQGPGPGEGAQQVGKGYPSIGANPPIGTKIFHEEIHHPLAKRLREGSGLRSASKSNGGRGGVGSPFAGGRHLHKAPISRSLPKVKASRRWESRTGRAITSWASRAKKVW